MIPYIKTSKNVHPINYSTHIVVTLNCLKIISKRFDLLSISHYAKPTYLLFEVNFFSISPFHSKIGNGFESTFEYQTEIEYCAEIAESSHDSNTV